MVIRNYTHSPEDISDLKNIVEKRRTIYIYQYSGLKQINGVLTLNPLSYDIYLVNDSSIHGTGFLIPTDTDLLVRNCYRGYAGPELFTPDGKLNYDCRIRFVLGSFVNHVRKPKEPILSLSTNSLLKGSGLGPGMSSVEDEFKLMLNSEWIHPYPKYYNIEDMAIFDSETKNAIIGDFGQDFDTCPDYTIGELIDNYTKVKTIKAMSPYNQCVLTPFGEAGEAGLVSEESVVYNNGFKANLGEFKRNVSNAFYNIQSSLMDSIFSECNVVVDVESGLFNIPFDKIIKGSSNEAYKGSIIRTKYEDLKPEEIDRGYQALCESVGETVDRWLGETDFPEDLAYIGETPQRVLIHISNDVTDIRYSIPDKKVLSVNSEGKRIEESVHASGISSASDMDTAVQSYHIDGISM